MKHLKKIWKCEVQTKCHEYPKTSSKAISEGQRRHMLSPPYRIWNRLKRKRQKALPIATTHEPDQMGNLRFYLPGMTSSNACTVHRLKTFSITMIALESKKTVQYHWLTSVSFYVEFNSLHKFHNQNNVWYLHSNTTFTTASGASRNNFKILYTRIKYQLSMYFLWQSALI